jgi:hypothetical protein
MNIHDYKLMGDILFAARDGNVAAEYATHPTKGWRVPLCTCCADTLRRLQQNIDKEAKD